MKKYKVECGTFKAVILHANPFGAAVEAVTEFLGSQELDHTFVVSEAYLAPREQSFWCYDVETILTAAGWEIEK